MGSFVNASEYPDEPDPANPDRIPITKTRTLWVRQLASGEVEMYNDGKFIASWGVFNNNVAVAMMQAAYDRGLADGNLESRKKFREALGL